MTDFMNELKTLRDKIDRFDDEILALLTQRAEVVQSVGELKREKGVETAAFYRPEREEQILRRLQAQNKGPLTDAMVARLFREIMSACFALEQPVRVAFLGPVGTFSHAATLKQFGHAVDAQAVESFAAIFRAVEAGQCHFGIVPVENASEGAVAQVLDLLARSGLQVCAEVVLPIEQCLLGKDENWRGAQKVFSHAQSLGQCRAWLAEHLPNAQLVEVSSNAEAARLASSENHALAVAGRAAAELFDLRVLQAGIEDMLGNATRFWVLGKQSVAPSGEDKTSVVVSMRNTTGALYRVLEPFARLGVSLTRVESRPSRQNAWEYMFFLDFEGHVEDSAVQAVLAELKESAAWLRVLGSYPAVLREN